MSGQKTKPHVPNKRSPESIEPGAKVKISETLKGQDPISYEQGNGVSICFIRGLRVLRLLDLRRVSGSKSDTPTRAKNCEDIILKCAENVKGFK